MPRVTLDLTDEQFVELMLQGIKGRQEPVEQKTVYAHVPHSEPESNVMRDPCLLEGCQRLGDDRRMCLRSACPHSAANAEARTGVSS